MSVFQFKTGAASSCVFIPACWIVEIEEVEIYKMPFCNIYPMLKSNIQENPIAQRYTAHAIFAINEMKGNFKQMFESGEEIGLDMTNMKELIKIL